MAKVKEGDRITFVNNTGNEIKGGSLINAEGFYGVVYKTVKNAEEGVLIIEGVVKAEAVDPTVAIAKGDKVVYTQGKVNKATGASGEIVIGKAVEDKPAGETEVSVKLNPFYY